MIAVRSEGWESTFAKASFVLCAAPLTGSRSHGLGRPDKPPFGIQVELLIFIPHGTTLKQFHFCRCVFLQERPYTAAAVDDK